MSTVTATLKATCSGHVSICAVLSVDGWTVFHLNEIVCPVLRITYLKLSLIKSYEEDMWREHVSLRSC